MFLLVIFKINKVRVTCLFGFSCISAVKPLLLLASNILAFAHLFLRRKGVGIHWLFNYIEILNEIAKYV